MRVEEFVFPFLNAVSAKEPDMEKILATLERPLMQMYSDLGLSPDANMVRDGIGKYVADENAQNHLLETAWGLREMIKIATFTAYQPAPDFIGWLEKNRGHLVYEPSQWKGPGNSFFVPRFKGYDFEESPEGLHFQMIFSFFRALFIHWVSEAFKGIGGDMPTGYFYLGICPHCNKAYTKKNSTKGNCGGSYCKKKTHSGKAKPQKS